MQVKLSKQIMVDGEYTSELELQEPTFASVVAMSALIPVKNPFNTKETIWRQPSEGEQTLALVSKVANITQKEAGSLSMDDMASVLEVISPFLTSQANQL